MNGEQEPLDLPAISAAALYAVTVYASSWESSLVTSLALPVQGIVSDGDVILTCPDNSPRSSRLADYLASVHPSVILRMLKMLMDGQRLAENLRIAQALATANIKAVTVNPGDVLVIRMSDSEHPTTHDQFAELSRNLSGHFPVGTPVLLTNDIDISALDEEAMRMAGWVKA